MNRDPTEAIAAVLRTELGLGDFRGDQLYEGSIDPNELAAAVIEALGLVPETGIHSRGPTRQRRWVTAWEDMDEESARE